MCVSCETAAVHHLEIHTTKGQNFSFPRSLSFSLRLSPSFNWAKGNSRLRIYRKLSKVNSVLTDRHCVQDVCSTCWAALNKDNTEPGLSARDPETLTFINIYSLQRRLKKHAKSTVQLLILFSLSSLDGKSERERGWGWESQRERGSEEEGQPVLLSRPREGRPPSPSSSPSHLLSILSHPYLPPSRDATP